MAEPSKCTLNNILQSILAVANQSANAFYPPSIFQSQFNTVTSLLISALVKSYPDNPEVIDMLSPFIRVAKIPVTDGYVQLPEEYRNILGTPMINVRADKSGLCGGDSDIPVTANTFKTANMKAGCKRRPVVIVPQAEFADQTTSTYREPTYWDPIGYMNGKKQLFVCPYDIAKVDVMYCVQEKSYVFPYITQPDDTYIFDANSSSLVESEWTSAAFTHIFNAMTALYSAYSHDPNMRDWSMILKKEGIL